MKNVFALGGCRLLGGLRKLGYPILSNWYYIHNVSQAIQACRFLREEFVYPEDVYKYVSIWEEIYHPPINNIRKAFSKAEIIFLELSTIKNLDYKGFLINEWGQGKKILQGLNTRVDSKHDIIDKLTQLERMINKPMVYVPHVYSEEWLTKIPVHARKIIEEAMAEFCGQNSKRVFVSPSKIIAQYGDKMMKVTAKGEIDTYHYSEFGDEIMMAEYKRAIDQVEKNAN